MYIVIYIYTVSKIHHNYIRISYYINSPQLFFLKLAMPRSQWDFKGPPDLSIGPRSMLTGMVGLPHDWG